MQETVRAAREHSLHLNQEAPTRATRMRRRGGKEKENRREQASAFSFRAANFQQTSWKSEILTAPEPYGYETQNARSRTRLLGAAFLWLAAALATGIWTHGSGVVVSLGTCIYLSRATPEKLMAQEGREAWRAASRFPLPAGARCIVVVEKPANNGPGSGVRGRGLRAGLWEGGEGLREVGGGEVDRGETGRRRGEKREKKRKRGKDRQTGRKTETDQF